MRYGFQRSGSEPEFFDTIEDAARAILDHDQQTSGVERDGDFFTPWQRPHQGPLRRLIAYTAMSEAEALKKVWMGAGYGEFRFIDGTWTDEGWARAGGNGR